MTPTEEKIWSVLWLVAMKANGQAYTWVTVHWIAVNTGLYDYRHNKYKKKIAKALKSLMLAGLVESRSFTSAYNPHPTPHFRAKDPT